MLDPNALYQSMGISLISQGRKRQLTPLPAPEGPKLLQPATTRKQPMKPKPPIPGQLFYNDSRYYHRPPPLPKLPKCTCGVTCRHAKAVIKCFSCIKFDAEGKGFYCKSCFEARHPWYRAQHTFLPLDQTEKAKLDHQKTSHWVEADRKVAEMAELLKKTQGWIEQIESDSIDYKADDMLKESGKKLLKAEERIRALLDRLKGKDSNAMVLKEAEQMPAELESIVKSTDSTTSSKSKKKTPALDLAQVQREPLTEEEAAIIIQSYVRRYLALSVALNDVQEIYCIKYEQNLGIWYYYNTLTNTSSWKRPPLINRKREYLLHTPRSHKKKFAEKQATMMALIPVSPEQVAARKLQGFARIWKAKKRARQKIKKQYVKVWDDEQGLYYYFNRQTSEASWEKPKLLGDEDLDISHPNDTESSSWMAWKRSGSSVTMSRTAPMSEDEAVAVLQGFFRTALARRRVVGVIMEQFRKIYDESSGNYYYFNKKTGKSTWDKPLLLGGYDLDPEPVEMENYY